MGGGDHLADAAPVHSAQREIEQDRRQHGGKDQRPLAAAAVFGLPLRSSLRGFGAGLVLHIHEVVTDHVEDDHVTVLDAAHVRMAHLDVELGERTEFSAIAAGEGDGAAADGIAVFDGAQHVGRVRRSR